MSRTWPSRSTVIFSVIGNVRLLVVPGREQVTDADRIAIRERPHLHGELAEALLRDARRLRDAIDDALLVLVEAFARKRDGHRHDQAGLARVTVPQDRADETRALLRAGLLD